MIPNTDLEGLVTATIQTRLIKPRRPQTEEAISRGVQWATANKGKRKKKDMHKKKLIRLPNVINNQSNFASSRHSLAHKYAQQVKTNISLLLTKLDRKNKFFTRSQPQLLL